MKKAVTIVLLAGMLACSASGHATSPDAVTSTETAETKETDLNRDNPIDRAFARNFQEAQTTPVIQYVNEAYLEAWKAEMANAAAVVKKSFTHREDDRRVDEYLAAYTTLIDKAFDLEMINWVSDPEESIASRSFGTGATGAGMLARARLYKQATLNLITHLQTNSDATYTFTYSGKGADMTKLREGN